MQYIFNIDYNTNQILVYQEGKLRVFDIGSWQETASYPASYSGISPLSVRFCYDTVYDSELGLRLKIM
jgi:hypothetical protein